MPIIPLYGHALLRERLAAAVARGALPGSLLLHGPRGVGKQRLALWLGQLLLCAGEEGSRPCGRCSECRFTRDLTHPDLRWRFPRPRQKGGEPSAADIEEDYAEATAERVAGGGLYPAPTGSDGIFIATVLAMVRSAALSPALGRRKVFVVGDAERMVPQEGADQAANAFLKLLEEPPADTTIILTSSEPGGLLPTVRSRVSAVRVAPLGEKEMRQFLADPLAMAALGERGIPASDESRVRLAGGAPGRLLSQAAADAALVQAKRLLAAATSPDRADAASAAFAQGAAGARGAFTDTLDMLTVLLHARTRDAVRDAQAEVALAAATATERVEHAKEMASGNVSPQLIAAALLREIGVLFP